MMKGLTIVSAITLIMIGFQNCAEPHQTGANLEQALGEKSLISTNEDAPGIKFDELGDVGSDLSTQDANLKTSVAAAAAANTTTVKNTSELKTAMANAKGGDVINVAPGTYGSISFSSAMSKSPNVVVKALNSSSPPKINGELTFAKKTKGFTLDGLVFSSNQVDKQKNGNWPAGKGLMIGDSNGFVVRNCIFENYHIAMDAAGSENLLLEFNEFRYIGMDSIRLYGHFKNTVIRNNYFHSPKVDTARSKQSGRHPDHIQLAAGWQPSTNASGLLIENNRFITFKGYHQVLFLYNENVARAPFMNFDSYSHKDITVRGNYILHHDPIAIGLGGVKNALVERNLIRPLEGSSLPMVVLYGKNSGKIVNNVWVKKSTLQHSSGVWLISDKNGKATIANITATQNQLSNTAVPSGFSMPVVGPYGKIK